MTKDTTRNIVALERNVTKRFCEYDAWSQKVANEELVIKEYHGHKEICSTEENAAVWTINITRRMKQSNVFCYFGCR